MLVGLILFKRLKHISRALLLTAVSLLLIASDILPWQSVLRFTFLTVFQYTERLIYFLPAFIIMALFIADVKYLAKMLTVAQIAFYLITNPLTFLPNASPYKEKYGLVASNIEVMRAQNTQATNAYMDPYHTTYWTSGDEYFNLAINHDQVTDGTINQFIYDASKVSVENITQSYNNLEFDVILTNQDENATITLPRIWYKGYTAVYTNGADGTQPEIEYIDLTNEELQQYEEAYKPSETTKALHNGQATIQIEESGHVRITYSKTKNQIIGFSVQCVAWLLLAAYLILTYQGRKKTL